MPHLPSIMRANSSLGEKEKDAFERELHALFREHRRVLMTSLQEMLVGASTAITERALEVLEELAANGERDVDVSGDDSGGGVGAGRGGEGRDMRMQDGGAVRDEPVHRHGDDGRGGGGGGGEGGEEGDGEGGGREGGDDGGRGENNGVPLFFGGVEGTVNDGAVGGEVGREEAVENHLQSPLQEETGRADGLGTGAVDAA